MSRSLPGIPWRSSGWDSTLPLQGARVQSLVSELRSHMLRGGEKGAYQLPGVFVISELDGPTDELQIGSATDRISLELGRPGAVKE